MAPAPTPEQIETWKVENGAVYEIAPEPGSKDAADQSIPHFYFKRPGRPQLSRLTAELQKDPYKAVHRLVMDCLIWPGPEQVEQLFNDKPGLVIALGNELQAMIGLGTDFLTRRL